LGFFCGLGNNMTNNNTGESSKPMSRIALVRVDDRLIHGQVVIKWLGRVGSGEILIVDDELQHDRFMQSVLRLAAPPGSRVEVLGVQAAAERLAPRTTREGSVIVLVRSPETALQLLEHGVAFSELNIGGLAGGPDAVRLFKSVSATERQMAALRAVGDRGVRVYYQMVPEERPIEVSEVLRARHPHVPA